MQKSKEVFQVNLKFIRHFFSSLEVLPKQLRQSLALGRFGNPEGGGALCVEMEFCKDISWESRCNIEINI